MAAALDRVMLGVYGVLMHAAVPLLLTRLVWRELRHSGHLTGWRERFGYVAPAAKAPVWIHAVSVGEVQAALPLIRELRGQNPETQVVVTTTTLTGREIARRQLQDDVRQYAFPFDLPVIVRRTLNRLQPRLLVLIETELWPFLILECRRRGIATVVANARLSERSARRYRMAGPLTRLMLRSIDCIAAQTESDADRFVQLGADASSVHVCGNMKFDVRAVPSVAEVSQALRRRLGEARAVWVAGSTRAGEEGIVLEAFRRVLTQFGDCLLVLAPRHPERAGDVADLCRRAELSVRRCSQFQDVDSGTQVYLVDTIGELIRYYSAADVTFVGGSLVDRGGQNLLEPASVGKPIISGPSTYNFAQAAEMLRAAGALQIVTDATGLADAVCALLADGNRRFQSGEAARKVYRGNTGASARILRLVQPFLRH